MGRRHGQTQFMPKNFMDYAIEFSGDGKRDILGDVRSDRLDRKLPQQGRLEIGLPWGFEVLIPQG